MEVSIGSSSDAHVPDLAKSQELKGECPFCLKAYDVLSYVDSFMVECSLCSRWTHRGCDGITEELYKELGRPERANEPFRCVLCRKENETRFDSAELNNMAKETDQKQVAKADEAAPVEEAWKPPPDLFSTLWGIVR